MNVYEQQARALKEIAAELKGIRRALDIVCKHFELDADPLADWIARQKDDQAVEREEEVVYMCSFYGGKCDQKHPGFCSDPCYYRSKGGAGNG